MNCKIILRFPVMRLGLNRSSISSSGTGVFFAVEQNRLLTRLKWQNSYWRHLVISLKYLTKQKWNRLALNTNIPSHEKKAGACIKRIRTSAFSYFHYHRFNNKVPPADSPAPVDDDKSCLRALVALGLVIEPSAGMYALSDKGEEYMSLSDLEQ